MTGEARAVAVLESKLRAPAQRPPAMIRRALPAGLFAPSLIAACAFWVQAPTPAQSRLLEQIPAEAHTVFHLQDATVILEQIKRNDVYRLLGDEAGEPLYDQLRGMSANDFDDMKLATAYIEEKQHSSTTFTDANRTPQDLFWIGRDSVYVQVVDANANVDPCCPG